MVRRLCHTLCFFSFFLILLHFRGGYRCSKKLLSRKLTVFLVSVLLRGCGVGAGVVEVKYVDAGEVRYVCQRAGGASSWQSVM